MVCDPGNLNSCILFLSIKKKEVWSAPWRWCWGQALQHGLQSRVSSIDTSGLAWGGGYSWELESDLTAHPLSHLPLFYHTLEITCSTLSAGCSDNWSLCLKEVDKQLGGYLSGACHFFLPLVASKKDTVFARHSTRDKSDMCLNREVNKVILRNPLRLLILCALKMPRRQKHIQFKLGNKSSLFIRISVSVY